MEFTGTIKEITADSIAFTSPCLVSEFYKLKNMQLKIQVNKFREKRSLDANAYMWVLLQKIAEVLHTDKWFLYLLMLKRYGHFTYIVVKPNAVEGVKKQWRECEVVGEVDINGEKAMQMLCYYGSSTYDSKQMAYLLDKIVDEARDLEIDVVSPDELRQMKERWGV